MKQTIVGSYYLGPESVQLVLREGTGGEFWSAPEKGACARIKVGADCSQWSRVVEVLLHEAMELAMMRIGARFEPAPDYAAGHDSYLFMMDHPKFTEAAARAGGMMADSLPDLAKAWNKWRKKK